MKLIGQSSVRRSVAQPVSAVLKLLVSFLGEALAINKHWPTEGWFCNMVCSSIIQMVLVLVILSIALWAKLNNGMAMEGTVWTNDMAETGPFHKWCLGEVQGKGREEGSLHMRALWRMRRFWPDLAPRTARPKSSRSTAQLLPTPGTRAGKGFHSSLWTLCA